MTSMNYPFAWFFRFGTRFRLKCWIVPRCSSQVTGIDFQDLLFKLEAFHHMVKHFPVELYVRG